MSYCESEFKEEILFGYQQLLEEKEEELKSLKAKHDELKKKVGYEIARQKLEIETYGSGLIPSRRMELEENVSKAENEYHEFEQSQKYIERTMHLPREIENLKNWIENLKNN